MGLRVRLDRCGKSRPTRIRSPDRPARRQSLYRLRYPAYLLTSNFYVNLALLVNAKTKKHPDAITTKETLLVNS